jgi:hypothetical protein
MKNESRVIQLMSALWGGSQVATGHSWLRLNQGLHDGLFLAIRIGLKFEENDLEEISKRFRGGYWFGCNFESFYTVAVVYGNSSAWKAYEHWKGRKPYILKPAKVRERFGGGGQGINNPPRLVVGAEFIWNNEWVKVTSFNDTLGYMVAQSYTQNESKSCGKCGYQLTWPKEKILHRYSITHADLKLVKKDQPKTPRRFRGAPMKLVA